MNTLNHTLNHPDELTLTGAYREIVRLGMSNDRPLFNTYGLSSKDPLLKLLEKKNKDA